MFAEEEALAFEQQNDRRMAELRQKVSRMKTLGTEIHDEVEKSNQILGHLSQGMDGAGMTLESVMARLGTLRHNHTGRAPCWIIAFVVGIFLFLYYGFGWVMRT